MVLNFRSGLIGRRWPLRGDSPAAGLCGQCLVWTHFFAPQWRRSKAVASFKGKIPRQCHLTFLELGEGQNPLPRSWPPGPSDPLMSDKGTRRGRSSVSGTPSLRKSWIRAAQGYPDPVGGFDQGGPGALHSCGRVGSGWFQEHPLPWEGWIKATQWHPNPMGKLNQCSPRIPSSHGKVGSGWLQKHPFNMGGLDQGGLGAPCSHGRFGLGHPRGTSFPWEGWTKAAQWHPHPMGRSY